MDKNLVSDRGDLNGVQRFNSVFEIKNPQEWGTENDMRRLGQWNHKFKSLDDYEIRWNNQNESSEEQIDNLLKNLNDENYLNFIAELKSLYIASILSTTDSVDGAEIRTIHLLDQHFNRCDKTDEYKLKRSQALENLISHSYKVNLEIYSKSLRAFKKLPDDLQSTAKLSDRNRKLANAAIVKTLINEELTEAEKRLFSTIEGLTLGKNANILIVNNIKKELLLYLANKIAERYRGVDRNDDMEIDMFQTVNGITEKLEKINRFIIDNPQNDYTKLFRQYIEMNEYRILDLMNDRTAYSVVTSRNLEFYDAIGKIADDLSCITAVIQMSELGEVVQSNLIEQIERFICKDLFLHRGESTNILQGLINSKINAINRNLLDRSHRLHLKLPKIDKFVEALNDQMILLSKTHNEQDFCKEYYLLQRIAEHLDDIAEKSIKIIPSNGEPDDLNQQIKNQILEVKTSIENLKRTLTEEGIYHGGFQSFIEAILNFFAELFNLKQKVIFLSKESLPMNRMVVSEIAECNPCEGVKITG